MYVCVFWILLVPGDGWCPGVGVTDGCGEEEGRLDGGSEGVGVKDPLGLWCRVRRHGIQR